MTYTQQAETFLTNHGLQFRAVLKDTKTPSWEDTRGYCPHYRVTISRYPIRRPLSHHASAKNRLSFDFWDSIRAGETGEPLTPYDVLACISGDASTPETFEEFCGEYGYNTDSRKAHALWKRCDRFAKRLRAFFTAQELEALSEIQ